MQNLSVVVPKDSKRFFDSLLLEAGNEFDIKVNDNTVTVFDIKDNAEKLFVAMAKAVINQYEKELLVKAINRKCLDFSKQEKLEIWKNATKHLCNDLGSKNSDYYNRINSVERSLRDFFKESDSLLLQGFVNFRLSEYVESLEDLAECSATEFKIDCEYREFVMMLKYFLSLQPPKFADVHIFYGNDVLIFGDGTNVTEEYVEEYKSEVGASAENKDDFVLNSLILIAPQKIKLIITDVAPEKEFIDTLKNVFENRISIN